MTKQRKNNRSWSKKLIVMVTSALVACGLAFSPINTMADVGCVDAKVMSGKLITNICWDCVFPIIVMGVPISGKNGLDRVPSGAAKKPACICYDEAHVPAFGVQTSFFQPNRLVELQRVPGCSSVLNGFRFPFSRVNQGTDGRITENSHAANDWLTYRHYHYYSFPVMRMLDMFLPKQCTAGGFLDLDIMFLSETDPTWSNDELAFFTNPEAALIASPLGALACVPDAVSANFGKPIESLFWCAGSWGSIYPLSGSVFGRDGVLRTTSLLATKAIAALHRRGLEWKTMGNDTMCGGQIAPYLPKNQYRISLF